MKIAPNAKKLNDGFFDVINIGDIKTAKILLNAYKLYGGSHLDLKEVKSTLAKRIEVAPFKNDEIIYLETDGELPVNSRFLRFCRMSVPLFGSVPFSSSFMRKHFADESLISVREHSAKCDAYAVMTRKLQLRDFCADSRRRLSIFEEQSRLGECVVFHCEILLCWG